MHVYEVRPRKDRRGFNLVSDALPFGRLWYGEPNAVSNAIDYAKFYSRSHDAVIRVYDNAGIDQLCHLIVNAVPSQDADIIPPDGNPGKLRNICTVSIPELVDTRLAAGLSLTKPPPRSVAATKLPESA